MALTKEQKDRIKKGQGWKCGHPHCTHGKGGTRATIKTGGQIHHRNRDPNDTKVGNLVALCRKCHERIPKRSRDPFDSFLKWAGR